MAKVSVIFTGGTIASVYEADRGGAAPALSGAELVGRMRQSQNLPEMAVIDWGCVPGAHLSWNDVIEIHLLASKELARPDVDGVVVVQGTDTIEETSFAFDLLVPPGKAVVVVGAMRSANMDGYEGLANLRDAVVCAASPQLSDAGCVVVMDGEVHGADDVRKVHATAYSAFKSPNVGPIGLVGDGDVRVLRSRRRRRHVGASRVEGPVPIVTATVDDDGSVLGALLATHPRGVVIDALGAGNTSSRLFQVGVQGVNAGVVTVLCSRCQGGRAVGIYDFEGGGAQWEAHGAIMGGYLGALKARVATMLGLGGGMSIEDLKSLIAADDVERG